MVVKFGDYVKVMPEKKFTFTFVKSCSELSRTKTQHSFVHGELGRTTLLTKRAVYVIIYWLKMLNKIKSNTPKLFTSVC